MKRQEILKARSESQGFYIEINKQRIIVKLIEEMPQGYFTVEDCLTKK